MKTKNIEPARNTENIKILVDSVLNGPGRSDPRLRQTVAQRVGAHSGPLPKDAVDLPPEISCYVDKIALHAYRVTDADIEALLAAGYSEDVIFELTVSAALGAGIVRLNSGMEALAGGQDAT